MLDLRTGEGTGGYLDRSACPGYGLVPGTSVEETTLHLADKGEIVGLTWEARTAAAADEALQPLIAHVKQATRS